MDILGAGQSARRKILGRKVSCHNASEPSGHIVTQLTECALPPWAALETVWFNRGGLRT